jgi:hypothetical protein
VVYNFNSAENLNDAVDINSTDSANNTDINNTDINNTDINNSGEVQPSFI